MVVWKGGGILVVIFAAIVLFVTGKAIDAIGFETGEWVMGVALILSGIPTWFAGKALNKETDGKVFVDKASGEEFRMGPQHSFFFIRMEYWGPILVAIGIIYAIIHLVK
jgi:hypothetical protein